VTAEQNRLLVVDDDANNRDMLSRRLIRRGYNVQVAEDGQQALDKIFRDHFDLILLDQMMPGMSGLDLLRLLRATYSQSELPVIMVTAVDESETVVEALNQGANDYVMKPVDLPVVAARIQAQLARSHTDRTTKMSDQLTGLCNRSMLSSRLASALIAQRRADRGLLAVLLLDLDGFKLVNDSFGHSTGDQLLIEVASRLRNIAGACGYSDPSSVARIGGDEFVVLIEKAENPDQVSATAQAILMSLTRPMYLKGVQVSVAASVGMALTRDGNCTPEDLLRDADLAMYRAKELGKNRCERFEPELRERVNARLTAAIDLRHAVERGELLALYQPKVELATRKIVGFEALLRWRHPQQGLVGPGVFIPIAEETGLIISIGDWILQEACRQLKIWQAKFPSEPPISMNVNLSVKQLSDPLLLSRVKKVLDETGIAAETLKLELTESALIPEIDAAAGVLSELRALHVGLKLDDFGTGYSSLSYLRNLHFDSLKIDRSFVSKLGSDEDTHAIVGTIVNLAHTLHMNVVAEGIETEQQLTELVELGCDSGQGYYFAKPLDTDAAEKLLETAAAPIGALVH